MPYRRIIIILALIILPFLALYANTRQPAQRSFAIRSIIYIQYPFEIAATTAIETLGSLWAEYVDLIDARAELTKAKEENARLKSEIQNLSEASLENQRLRSLLNFAERLESFEFVTARVYGGGVSPLAQSYRINKGAAEGIELYNAVMSGEGLIGRVGMVGEFFSEVIPITDNRSQIGARVKKNRVPCTIAGKGPGQPPEIRHLVATEKIEENDELVTDAVLPVFPGGLPIGSAVKIERRPNTLFVRALLEPFAKLERVEEVIVLINRKKE